MSILGLKTLPVNHPMHQVYRITAGVIGVLLAALGVVALISTGDEVLVLSASNRFAAFLLVAGAVLVAVSFVGGNVAAHVNAWVGALLITVGLVSMLVLRHETANLLQIEMSDVIVLFLVGMVLLAAGFYGQVGASAPYGEHGTPEEEDPPQTGEPAIGYIDQDNSR